MFAYNKDFLSKLFKDIWVPYDFSEETAEAFYEDLSLDIRTLFPSYNYGASKFVLIPENEEYVIKIPFKGTYYGWDADEEFCNFVCAPHGEWDYCEEEVYRYNYATELGFKQFLAQTQFLCNTGPDDYPIYIQEKSQIFSRTVEYSSHSKADRVKTIKIIDKTNMPINIDWLTDLRLYHGDEKFSSFLSFIKNAQWDDLREDNIGYIGNKPVLVDYAGFYE